MGKKGAKKTLKRKPAPSFWPIHKKEFVWAVKPKPGPHPTYRCIPLVLIVRDSLGLGNTSKEAKIIISKGKILVDGKVRREPSFPVGLMDVVSIPETNTSFRVLPSTKGLILHRIPKEEEDFKLCRIEGKNIQKGGRIQLSLHDGRNILLKEVESGGSSYRTLDVLKINLPDQEPFELVKSEKGVPALAVGGKNAGKYGRIVEIEARLGLKRRRSLVTLEDSEGDRFQVILDYVFVLGEDTPLISLPGGIR